MAQVVTDQLFQDKVYEVTPSDRLPKKPAKLDEETRERMRHLGKTSLYYLCKVILGYDKLVPHVHMPMCEFADSVGAYRRLMLMPRTHFKTTIWTIGQSIKDIINDPNVTILMIADTAMNASRFMSEIQQHFERNELFRWLYPEVIPDNFNTITWSNKEMVVPRERICREPTIDAIGALGGSESRHYDKIRADDLITEKCMRSDVEMDKVIKWAGGLESLLNQPLEQNQIDWVGSRKKKGDLYEEVEKQYGKGYEVQDIGPHATQKGKLAIYWRRDIEDGKPIFPEAITMDFLMRLKRTYPERYHAQYANSPKGTGLNTFEGEDLRYWQWSHDGRMIVCAHEDELLLRMSAFGGERIILYDPALSKSSGASQQAILVLLKGNPIPFRICLEAHVGHFPPDEAVQMLFDLNRKWRPSLISVEHRGFQGAIRYWAREKSERDNLPMPPLLEWPPKGSPKAQWAKNEHIRSLQPLTRNHLIWLHKSQSELVEQFEYHPNVRYDDGVDAFSQSLDYWEYMESDAEAASREGQELDFLERALGVDRSLVVARKAMDEMEMLKKLNATGYRLKIMLGRN